MADVHIVLFEPEIQKVLKAPGDIVDRHLIIVGEQVKQAAIRLAPKRTGNLAAHIVKRIGRTGDEPQVLVGVENVPYAIWVHEGANPHTIVATNAPALVFYWAKAGGIVAFRSVNHPGNPPNRFLLKAAQRVLQLGQGLITEGEFLTLTGGI